MQNETLVISLVIASVLLLTISEIDINPVVTHDFNDTLQQPLICKYEGNYTTYVDNYTIDKSLIIDLDAGGTFMITNCKPVKGEYNVD